MDIFNACVTNRKFSKDECDLIFTSLDANGNGQIDYLEFQALFAAQVLFQDERSLLNEFKRIDTVSAVCNLIEWRWIDRQTRDQTASIEVSGRA